jgi:hypothetical protein
MGPKKLRNVARIQIWTPIAWRLLETSWVQTKQWTPIYFWKNNTLTTPSRHLLLLESDAIGDNESLTGSEEMLELDDECVEGIERSLAHVRYSNRFARFIDAYQRGLTGAEASWANHNIMAIAPFLWMFFVVCGAQT